jgi:hypothetical protein
MAYLAVGKSPAAHAEARTRDDVGAMRGAPPEQSSQRLRDLLLELRPLALGCRRRRRLRAPRGDNETALACLRAHKSTSRIQGHSSIHARIHPPARQPASLCLPGSGCAPPECRPASQEGSGACLDVLQTERAHLVLPQPLVDAGPRAGRRLCSPRARTAFHPRSKRASRSGCA